MHSEELHTRKYYASLFLFLALLLPGFYYGITHFSSFLEQLASSIDSVNQATTTLYFMPSGDETISQGGTTSVDVDINTKVPINALGATISFPKDSVEVVGISKERSFFDLWTEDTTISEDAGEIRFSGGITRKGGLLGTGTVLTLTLRAKGGDSASIDFKSAQVYPSDATGKPVTTNTRAITFSIAAPTPTPQAGSAGSAPALNLPLPNADLNGDGRISLIDLSILTLKVVLPYDPRFDLNGDGAVNLGDISALLSRMH